MTMFVSLSTKAPGPVGPFAGGTDGGLGIKGFPDTIGLPLHHTNCHGLVQIVPIVIETRVVDCNANVGGSPGCRGVRVANTAHIPRFEVLLALFTDRQPRVWELDI